MLILVHPLLFNILKWNTTLCIICYLLCLKAHIIIKNNKGKQLTNIWALNISDKFSLMKH